MKRASYTLPPAYRGQRVRVKAREGTLLVYDLSGNLIQSLKPRGRVAKP